MKLIPYKKSVFQVDLNADEIRRKLEDAIASPSWRIDMNKFEKNKFFEGKIDGNRFEIAYGAYGLTYGRSGPIAVLIGKIIPNKNIQNHCLIKVQLRPRYFGLMLTSIVICAAVGVFLIGIRQNDLSAKIGGILLVLYIYINLIYRFNHDQPRFDAFLLQLFEGHLS